MFKMILRKKFSLAEKIFGKDLTNFAKGGNVSSDIVRLSNFVDGKWHKTECYEEIINPLNGKPMFLSPITDNFNSILSQIEKCPKSGLFNPLKKPESYRKWGNVCMKAASLLSDNEIQEVMTNLVQNCIPKSRSEVLFGEVLTLKHFLENYAGDNARFALKGIRVAGDREGQESVGYRFPFGPVMIISPFNVPLKISAFNLIGALICGNMAVLKPDNRCGIAIEALVKLLLYAGMPPESMILMHNNRQNSSNFVKKAAESLRLIQFTGSSKIANELALITKGKVRMEDSGYNWMILDEKLDNVDHTIRQIDQDAFSASGQKCSALRLLVYNHELDQINILDKIADRAKIRSFQAKTICPLLSLTNSQVIGHINAILSQIEGAKLITGNSPVSEKNDVPAQYGLIQPTLLFVPWKSFKNEKNLQLLFKEIFGPILIATSYQKDEIDNVLSILNKTHYHLTAAVISQDVCFTNKILANSVNGATYVGRGRTTGAPQNHFFGPSNDPRASGVGTPKAILDTWTCHREIIYDYSSFEEVCSPIPQS